MRRLLGTSAANTADAVTYGQILTLLTSASHSQTIGDGTSTDITVTHNLATRDVVVSVLEAASPYSEVDADVDHLDANTLVLHFAPAPSAGQYRVVVLRAGTPGAVVADAKLIVLGPSDPVPTGLAAGTVILRRPDTAPSS